MAHRPRYIPFKFYLTINTNKRLIFSQVDVRSWLDLEADVDSEDDYLDKSESLLGEVQLISVGKFIIKCVHRLDW
jgi:hypothetical protein